MSAFAQVTQRDMQAMGSINASHAFNQSWSFSIMAQALLNQNLSELWIANGDIGVGYQFNSNWKAEMHFRAIKFRTPDNDYQNRNLIYNTLTYTNSWGKWSIALRNRLQQLTYEDHFNDSFKGPLWYNRDRLTLKYRIDYYWAPYLSLETFVPLNHSTRSGIDQWRYAAGVVRTFNDRFKIDLRYQIQNQLQRSVHRINYLTAINCYIKF